MGQRTEPAAGQSMMPSEDCRSLGRSVLWGPGKGSRAYAHLPVLLVELGKPFNLI